MAIISAASQSFSLSSAIARHALSHSFARNVVSRLCNTYNLDGMGSGSITLSRFDDPGDADSIGFGVEYTGEIAGSTTTVTLTPARYAKGATVDQATYTQRVGGSSNGGFSISEVLASINGMSDAEFVSDEQIAEGVIMANKAFGPEMALIARSIRATVEKETTALFSSVTASAGSSGVDCSLANVEDAVADILGAASLPHGRLAIALDVEQIANLRAALTSAGAQGVLEAGLASMVAHDPDRKLDEAIGALLGCAVYTVPVEARVTANAGADVVGCVFLEGQGDPELSGEGYPGAFAIAVDGPAPIISAQYHGNAFGVRLVGSYGFDPGIRVNGWASKIVTDAP